MRLPLDATIKQLTAFESAARTGSYAQAGRELGCQRAAVQQLVQRLTKSVGAGALLERDGAGVRTTAVGATLLNVIRPALLALGALPPEEDPSSLRFSAFPAHLLAAAPHLLSFQEATGATVTVTGVSDNLRAQGGVPLAQLLASREVDVAVLPAAQVPVGSRAEHLYPWKLEAVLVPGHKLARPSTRQSISVNRLASVPLITSPEGHSTFRRVSEAFAFSRLKPCVALEAADPLVVMALLRQHPDHVAIVASDTIGVPQEFSRFALKSAEGFVSGSYVAACLNTGSALAHSLVQHLHESWTVE